MFALIVWIDFVKIFVGFFFCNLQIAPFGTLLEMWCEILVVVSLLTLWGQIEVVGRQQMCAQMAVVCRK